MKCIMKHFTTLKKEEQAGNLFVIRPEVPLQVDRMEKIQQNYKIYTNKAMKMQRDSLQICRRFAKISMRLWRRNSLQPFYYWFQC